MDDPSAGKPMEAQLEVLNAKVEALNEVKHGFNERFAAMSEKMGELRYMLVSYGKDIEETKAAAKKAISLVEDVQPSVVLAALRKSEAKVEVLQSKVESNDVIMNKIISEIKDIRHTTAQFEGVQKLQEVADGLKAGLKDAARSEAEMRRESQMVKDIFADIQGKLKEFRVFDERISGIGEEFKGVLKEFDQLKAGFMQAAKVEDLEKLKSGIDLRLKRADALVESAATEGARLRELVHSEKVERFAERLDAWLKAGTGIEANINAIQKRVDSMDRLDRRLEEREDRLEKLVGDSVTKIKQEKDTGEIRRQLEAASKAISDSKQATKKAAETEKALVALEKRLASTEKEMATLKKDIGAGIKKIILKQLQEI